MSLGNTLTESGYRKVLFLEVDPVPGSSERMRLAATFSSEAGPWVFEAPADVRSPYFVVSASLRQILVVLSADESYVGPVSAEVIRALKQHTPQLRHIVHSKKKKQGV